MATETLLEQRSGLGGPCVDCMRPEDDAPKEQDLVEKLSSAVRLCKLALAACLFFCLLLVLMFSCSVYLFMEIRTVHEEIAKCKIASVPEDSNLVEPAVTALYVQAEDFGEMGSQGTDNDAGRQFRSNDRKDKNTKEAKGPGKRGKKDKKRNCCKCCRKFGRLERAVRSLNQTFNNLRHEQSTEKPTPAAEPKDNRMSYVAAAHYSTYMTEDFINREFGVLDPGRLDQAVRCKVITEWHGEACRNRTYSPHHEGSPLTLNIFHEADWMKNISQEPLFDKTKDGIFIAKHTGIYLLYSHVLFYDAKTKQAIAIVHESNGVSKNVLRCMESVDYIDPSQDIGKNSRYKSCSVTGVLYMNTGDKVLVKNLYSHTRIDLTSDATYFGGLLFAIRNGT